MSDYNFEETIKEIQKIDKKLFKTECNFYVSLLDAYIDDIEKHLEDFSYDIGVKTGKLEAYKHAKQMFKEYFYEEENQDN